VRYMTLRRVCASSAGPGGKGGDMSFRYAVVGAGRQGVAAAYDMARFGDAREVLLIDSDLSVAKASAGRVNQLLGRRVTLPVQADATDENEMKRVTRGVTSIVSCVPYRLNPGLTEVAISMGANMCDLGGNTAVVREQIGRDADAKSAGVSIVPDCGMGPGMNVSLATYAMSLVQTPREVYIWDGGLPQNPKPPWNFQLTFNIGGLTNEYYGNAYFLRNGAITEVPCFEDVEELQFPAPIGSLEAAVTSGGLSTAPWTFEGTLDRLENKTLRYPGHWVQFRAYAQLGLLEPDPIRVGGLEVIPRDVFHALLEPKIRVSDVRDLAVMRVKCVGEGDGRRVEAVVELIDFYDEQTGFTAMQRLTGWHASIVAILSARGQVDRGAVPVELAVPGRIIVEEARRRGLSIRERIWPST
jgi:lysine 6-dehydrogenase